MSVYTMYDVYCPYIPCIMFIVRLYHAWSLLSVYTMHAVYCPYIPCMMLIVQQTCFSIKWVYINTILYGLLVFDSSSMTLPLLTRYNLQEKTHMTQYKYLSSKIVFILSKWDWRNSVKIIFSVILWSLSMPSTCLLAPMTRIDV